MMADETAVEPVNLSSPPAVRAADDTAAIMDAWQNAPTIEERRPETLPEVSRWAQMTEMAKYLARSPMMPKHIRDSRDPEADCMVVLLTAHDLGISATLALQKVAVIDGKPALMAELMRTLALRDGHRLRFEIDRDQHERPVAAHAVGFRKEDPEYELRASYTLADAVIAGLCRVNENGDVVARSSHGKPLPWEAFTEDMLVARATSRWCRRYAPDALGGVSYTPDELGEINTVENTAATAVLPYMPASDATIEMLRERVDRIEDDDTRIALLDAWKAEGLGLLGDPKDPSNPIKRIGVAGVDIALRLIDEYAARAPAEAELVHDPAGPHPFEGADSAVECAACGQPRVHELHVEPDPPAGKMTGGYEGRPSTAVGDPTAEPPPKPAEAATDEMRGGSGPVVKIRPLTGPTGKRVVFVDIGQPEAVRVDYNPGKGCPVPLEPGTQIDAGVCEGVVRSDYERGSEPF